ncbi:hypothetical protein BB558_001685 [Smittium angustum]|uniref:Major facilitator superfamily (MFS) profile domain-containing protein n=1 Tax=Smittium angustum TaxID=133377 RepID=A0A2U1JB41_SMIAN|nr:hypothetical protein BB558_001685 [Smittium angustum]
MKDNSSVVDIEKETLVLNQAEHLTENEIAIHKRYLRKVDLRVMPIVVLVSMASLIDRGIIAAALVYAPANIMLKRVKPHYWFSLIGLGFSISTLMQAFAKNGTTLTILRGLLGAFEAGISPGIVGYLNYWYTRSEVSLRMVVFFFAIPLAGLASKIRGSVSEAFKFLADWKLWVFCLIFFGNNNAANVLSLFIPTVATSLGYNPTQATMIYMGYYVVGLIGMIIYIFLLRQKPYWIVISFFSAFTAITYYVALFTKGKIVRVVFLMLTGFGTSPVAPIIVAWLSVNQGGVFKGMIATAIQLSFGNLSGVISPRLYTTQFYPKFLGGSILLVASLVVSIILSFVMTIYFNAENKRRDANPVDISHLSEDEQRRMYDKHPNFRYKS